MLKATLCAATLHKWKKNKHTNKNIKKENSLHNLTIGIETCLISNSILFVIFTVTFSYKRFILSSSEILFVKVRNAVTKCCEVVGGKNHNE